MKPENISTRRSLGLTVGALGVVFGDIGTSPLYAMREIAVAVGGHALHVLARPDAPIDCAHIFVIERSALERWLAALKPMLAPGGFVWVSWPKKASKVPTDITEDVIREVVLPIGLVDIKVAAVSDVWSGLKLMIRKELR